MATESLKVSFANLPDRHVAFLIHQTNQASGDFDLAIRATFDRVKSWVREMNMELDSAPAIGIAHVVGGQLHAYECCIPVAMQPVHSQRDAIQIKVLPGGKFAILRINKQSSGIGETIGRFFQDYVPRVNLQIDNSRPTYEIYWDQTLDFCVPVIDEINQRTAT